MSFADRFALEPDTTFLNHGSFGACPKAVLEEQSRLRARMEAQPVRFFMRELPELLVAARTRLAALLGADAGDLAFVPNATAAVNTVLRSIDLRAGDELLTTSHAYPACLNALHAIAGRSGATVVVAEVPFPIAAEEEVIAAVLRLAGPRVRLALLDHVTSPTALVFPAARLVNELATRGIDTMVDGAHGPGMLPLRLDDLGAAYYTGNCHKWLCAPKGAAFLHVRRDRQEAIRPLSISHGASADLEGRTRFRVEFDWTGTDDPTPALCIPASIDFLQSLLPGGLPALMARNHALAVEGRNVLAAALGIEAPAPDAMLGAMAALPIPDARTPPPSSPYGTESLQAELVARHAIEVPIVGWPAWPRRLIRISAQAYNRPEDYVKLAAALRERLSGY